jgi:hypothetical protein
MEDAMLSRSYLPAALLGLFLAGPAIADDRPPGRPPVTYIDTGALTINSDFTVFMHKDVPEDVRRAALRRLWVLTQLPVSCHELCIEPEPTPADVALAARRKLSAVTQ